MVSTDRLCLGCMNDNGGEKICPICGYDSSLDNPANNLSVGSWLNANRYLVGRALEAGGDGVTYIGWDNELNAVVYIREYFPAGIALRSGDRMTVYPAADKGIPFNRGMEEFKALFEKLGSLPKSVAILRVVEVFEANATVYAVQTAVSGVSLKTHLLKDGGTLGWGQVKTMFLPLLATVTELNESGIVHRGISPETIIVGRDGKLRLIGFSIKDVRVKNTEFSTQIMPGYAAPEQHISHEQCDELCDVYALGAVIFRCLIGSPPSDSTERMINDKLSIPAKITETVPKAALVAIAGTLKIDKAERTATVDRLRRTLDASVSAPVKINDPETQKTVKATKTFDRKNIIIAVSVTVAVFVLIIGILAIVFGDTLFGGGAGEDESSDITSSASQPSESVNTGPSERLYVVPDYVDKIYSDIMADEDLVGKFKIVIAGSEYSTTVERGKICRQEQAEGSELPRDSEIKLYISLGAQEIKMPNLQGQSKEQAYIQLLELGFYKNSIEFVEKSDESVPYNAVISTSVQAGSKVSVNDAIVIYINSTKPTPEDTAQDSSSNESSGAVG